MKILHIVKNTADHLAYDMIARQRAQRESEVSVLLLQDAVYTPPPEHSSLFVCRDDVKARGVESPGVLMSYTEIIELMLAADSVVTW